MQLLLLSAAAGAAAAGASAPTRQDIFVPSARYPCMRQPLLLAATAPHPTLLAFAENRNVSACAPAAAAARVGPAAPREEGSLLLRRSTDGGASWGPLTSMYFTPGLNIDFYSGVVDEEQAVVWVMLQEGKAVRVFRSDDAGATWGAPKSLFDDWHVPLPSGMSSAKPSCGHGVQLVKDLCAGGCADAGRLAVPFVCTNSSAPHGPGTHGDKGACPACTPCLLLSDDHGTTWRFGALGQQGGRESVVVQAAAAGAASALYATERNMGPTPGHRMVARSSDGGGSYDAASFGVDRSLSTPVTPHWTGIVASVARLSAPPASRVVYAGAAGDGVRANMTLRVSHDDGASWAGARVLWPGPAGYADVVAVPQGNGSAAVIFENGDATFSDRVSVAVVPLSWLEPAPHHTE